MANDQKTPENSDEKKSGWTGGQIAGAVMGILFFLIVLFFIVSAMLNK